MTVFVNLLKIKSVWDHTSKASQVIRWYNDRDQKPCIRVAVLKSAIIQWLDANCQGAWYEVTDRLEETWDRLLIARDDDYGWRDMLGRPAQGCTREIAFQDHRDALMFKLTWQ